VTNQDILSIFTQILRDLLCDDTIVLSVGTRRQDVPNWDSFNYINFIVAVENKFGVKFKVADIESFENVGAIVTETKALMRVS
jgi:acyl carrier protein